MPGDDTLQTRAELVRYFAWGYLSRRELTARLRRLDEARPRRSRHAAQATDRAA
jgi:hypothetical protein